MVPIMHHMTTASMTVPEWSLADRLIKARTIHNWSQADLAERLGISTSTVKRNEREPDHRRNRPYLLAVALTCGVDPDWLISGAATESEPPHYGPSLTVRYMAA